MNKGTKNKRKENYALCVSSLEADYAKHATLVIDFLRENAWNRYNEETWVETSYPDFCKKFEEYMNPVEMQATTDNIDSVLESLEGKIKTIREKKQQGGSIKQDFENYFMEVKKLQAQLALIKN